MSSLLRKREEKWILKYNLDAKNKSILSNRNFMRKIEHQMHATLRKKIQHKCNFWRRWSWSSVPNTRCTTEEVVNTPTFKTPLGMFLQTSIIMGMALSKRARSHSCSYFINISVFPLEEDLIIRQLHLLFKIRIFLETTGGLQPQKYWSAIEKFHNRLF